MSLSLQCANKIVGYIKTHVDEFIDELLHSDYCCDLALPHLPKRSTLEQMNQLPPRISALEDEDIPDDYDGELPKEKVCALVVIFNSLCLKI